MKCDDRMLYFLVIFSTFIREHYAITQTLLPYPQFFLQPSKQSVKRESTITIDCGVYGGIGNLTYTFYKGITPQFNMMTRLKEVESDPETGIASYFIPKINSAHKGYYQCVVNDEANVIIYSDVIYLDVIDNYLTRVQATTVTLSVLSTTKVHILNCTLPDSAPPAWPRWFRDGHLIEVDNSNMFVSYGNGEVEGLKVTYGDLVLYSVTDKYSGLYTCAAYNYLLPDSINQIDIGYYNITIVTSGVIGQFASDEAITSDLTISVGQRGYLFCGGIGNPSPQTRFLTIDPVLEGVKGQLTRLVSIPSNLTTAPAAYYSTCQVGSNFYTVKLTIVERPINSVDSISFTDTDTSPIVYYDEVDRPPITMSCDTNKEVSKQWFFNGQVWNKMGYHETDLNSGFDLIAHDVRPQDSGVYQCKAFSEKQLTIYRTQVLCVVKKLSIETTSPTLREIEGRPKKLSCSVTGSPTPNMLWSFNSRLLEESDNIVITNKALLYPYSTTLEIKNVTLNNTGNYECGVSNLIPAMNGKPERRDSVSATIAFKVVAPVRVTSPNTSVIAFANKDVVLECTTYGEPLPEPPVWKHQYIELFPDGEKRYVNLTQNAHGYTSRLTITNTSLLNQGNYTCSSSQKLYDVDEVASVTISVPIISPVSVAAPEEAEVEHGVVEKLTCKATGHPTATNITWFKYDTEITENITTTQQDNTLTSVLSLRAYSIESSGNYTCYSTNNYLQNFYYDNATILVDYVSAVKIKADERHMTGVYNTPITLVCRVTGNPLPTEVHWESRGVPMSDSKFVQIRNNRIGPRENPTELLSELTMMKVVYYTETLYNCTASNFFKEKYHDAKASIEVVVEYPVQVRTRAAYAYNSLKESVNVECEIEGKPLPYEVIWYFSGNPGQALTDSVDYTIISTSKDNIMNATLKIQSLSPTFSGDYNCTAHNTVNGKEYYGSGVINVGLFRQVIVSVSSSVVNNEKGMESALTCYGEGVPPPEATDIVWVFGGTGETLPRYSQKYLMEIQEERIYKKISILRISNTLLEDEGLYTCRFKNRDKTNSHFSGEGTVQLNVQVPVEVTFANNATVELYDGERTTLTCTIYGKPAPTDIRWVFSRTGATLATDDVYNVTTFNTSNNGQEVTSLLLIRHMSLQLEGSYECGAQNVVVGGKLVRRPAYKKVIRVEDVVLTPHSRSVSAEEGKTTRLICSAIGVPQPGEIGWRDKNGNATTIKKDDRFIVAETPYWNETRQMYTKVESTLTITMVRWKDRGTWTCESSNRNHGVEKRDENNIILNVGRAVSVNKNARSYQTLLGGTAGVITVPLYGYPEPSVSWQHNGVVMKPTSFVSDYITVEEYSGVTQLKFEDVELAHEGVYTLLGTNSVFGAEYKAVFSVEVGVNYKPVVNVTSSVGILEMSTQKIPCYVVSKPIPSSISWFYNDTEISQSSSFHSKYALEDMVVEEAGSRSGDLPLAYRTLVIKEARLEDSGLYMCRAANLIGKQFYTDETVVTVDVVSAVVVSSPETMYVITLGLELNLTCTATGFPKPNEISWFHNGTLIQFSDNILEVEDKSTFKERRSILSIQRATYDSFGDYECKSSNFVLGFKKVDKVIMSVSNEEMLGAVKTLTQQELMIIIILAAIIFIVIMIIVIVLYCRHKKKRQQKPYSRIQADIPAANGADSTLRADSKPGGLIEIDPTEQGRRYREVEYVELDPRVYKAGTHQFKPMPRKKRTEYATLEQTQFG